MMAAAPAGRDALIEKYRYLVPITAGRLFGPLPSGVERDDLVGAGLLGLCKAATAFDPERHVKFETYAITLIRGAILEMLRGDDWVPRRVREQQKQFRQAYTKLEAQFGRRATEEEIAEEMGISPRMLDKMLCNIGRANLLSLDDLLSGSNSGTEGAERFVDLLPADDPSPFDSIGLRERQRALVAAVGRLPERERTVIALYYHEGLTFKEVGAQLTISESRAYQLHAQAISRLRNYSALRDAVLG